MAKNNNAARLGEDLSTEDSALLDADRGNTAPVEKQPLPQAQQLAPEVPPVTPPENQEHALEGDHADNQQQQRRMVDYGAMKEERERRKKAEADLNLTKQQMATLTGRFQVLEQLANQQPKAEAPKPAIIQVPDIATDPVGHFQALHAQSEQRRQNVENELKQINEWRQAQEQNAQAMNNVQRLTQIALTHEAEFSKTQPEYQKAAAYVRDMRDAELMAMGYRDPAQRAQMIQNDALNIAAQALNANMNAAEVVWAIAQARGYNPAPPGALEPKPQPMAPAAPLAPNSDASKLKTVAEGQKVAQSLGQLNGAPPPQETLPERLLAMSEKDFEEATKGDKWRQLFS